MSNICLSTQRNFLVSFGVLDLTQLTHGMYLSHCSFSIVQYTFDFNERYLVESKTSQSVFVGLKYHLKWQPRSVKLTP